ncbi:MAG: DEAD/DEAH box helicase family protein [Halieaceae bacterium]|nr:DEAD/DEAH box helicase family protein [Halieaceae bacterium]
MSKFKDLAFPTDGEYSSDDGPDPIEFYLTVFPSSKEVFLKLGYFSSSAIQVLAYGFAPFIARGGKMSIVTNHFLYDRDIELLTVQDGEPRYEAESLRFKDPEWVHAQLSERGQHFLDCLKTLLIAGRLKIVPVKLRPSRMVHYKEGVFIDSDDSKISFTGSCNFTSNGLIENGESLSISRSWLSPSEDAKSVKKLKTILGICAKEDYRYEYLDAAEVLNAALKLGKERTVEDLLEQERTLKLPQSKNLASIFKEYKLGLDKAISSYKISPRFPYASGPRDYQIDAYKSWEANDFCGIFAMATGTGKTITSLNCLLELFQRTASYQAVVLVPTKALIEQWRLEVASFNFRNIISAYSGNSNWRDEVSFLITSLSFDASTSFVLITTYDTITESLLKSVSQLPKSTLLIADEAHNFGRDSIKTKIGDFPFEKRLALSATPKRRFDEEGNTFIEQYFRDAEPYTYAFSMERAIGEGVLCPYEYYPHVVELTPDEMSVYAELSSKLSKIYDHASGVFLNPDFAKILLLERRRVIHKAENKLYKFGEIVTELERYGKLSHAFVYVPEGDDKDGENLLRSYMNIYSLRAPNRRAHHYTSATENRDEVMLQFENENFDTLFSMKCLDEGVDVPRAEVAIFCSSTGNPRQFIQRRGRVLRQHPEKSKAIIHDLIVIPDRSGVHATDHKLEQKLISEELVRVVYFASLARNYYQAMEELTPVAERYDINLYTLQSELGEQ